MVGTTTDHLFMSQAKLQVSLGKRGWRGERGREKEMNRQTRQMYSEQLIMRPKQHAKKSRGLGGHTAVAISLQMGCDLTH